MKKLMILPGILLGACAAFAQAAPQAAAPTQAKESNTHGYEVSGTVVNAVNGEPLSKAKVSIYPALSDSADEQEQNVFQFRQANAQRFNNARGGAGGGGARGAGGRRGAAGAQNQDEEEPSTEALTDNTGHFAMKNVLPGRYSLFAERKGFPRQSLDRHGNFSTAVVVGAGKDSKNITFRVVPDSNITGRITDDFGDPVPNARVILFYKSSDTGEEGVRRRSTAGTDQDGSYHFNHLPPATYFVVVTAQPWYTMYARMMPQQSTDNPTQAQDGDANLDVAFPVTYYSGATDENDSTPIPLLPGDHFVADMTLNTSPAMHLQFTNMDPKTPMMPMLSTQAFGQEIFVNAMPMMRRGFGGQPGANGDQAPPTMTINVAPGRYDANIRSFNRGDGGGPGGGGPTNVRRMTIDATGNTMVDLTKGEEPAPVTGTVKFEGATDAPRGSIAFRKQESTEVVSARTNSDGEIQNLQLYPGKYNVAASYSHYVIKGMQATGAKVTGRTIEVTGTSPIKFSLQMTTEDARVDGVVQASDSDTPVSGVMVMLVPEDLAHNEPLVRRFQSNTDGSFEFTKVIPGKYTVVALRNGWNMQWAKPEVIQSYLAQGQPLEIGPKAKVVAKVKAQ